MSSHKATRPDQSGWPMSTENVSRLQWNMQEQGTALTSLISFPTFQEVLLLNVPLG